MKNEFKKLKVAIVAHIFYESQTDDIINYIKNIDSDFDIFISLNENKDFHKRKSYIQEKINNAYIFSVENRGRDIMPLVTLRNIIYDYDIACKIHTKRNNNLYNSYWRKIALDSVIEDKNFVSDIISAFVKNKRLVICGSDRLYINGKFMNNNTHKFFNDLIEIKNENWGFFAGTMFWFRPRQYAPLLDRLSSLAFVEHTDEDGYLEHAAERAFGAYAYLHDFEIGLVSKSFFGQPKIEIKRAQYKKPRRSIRIKNNRREKISSFLRYNFMIIMRSTFGKILDLK